MALRVIGSIGIMTKLNQVCLGRCFSRCRNMVISLIPLGWMGSCVDDGNRTLAPLSNGISRRDAGSTTRTLRLRYGVRFHAASSWAPFRARTLLTMRFNRAHGGATRRLRAPVCISVYGAALVAARAGGDAARLQISD